MIMTILGIFIPYARAILQMDDVLNADIQTISIIGPPHVISLVLAGGIAFYTFRRSLDEIADIKEHFI